MWYWWHVLLLLILVVVFGGVYNARYGGGGGGGGGGLRFVDHLFTKPSSCFSCERSNPTMNRTKCFECEHQLAGRQGPNSIGAGQPTKCFSCGENRSIFRDVFMRNRKPILGV